MPGLDDKAKATLTKERGGLPIGKLWATPGDDPQTTRHFISREFALDHGLSGNYPSWPEYPDARELPGSLADRAAWKVREANLVKKPEPGHANPVTAEEPGQTLCPVCHVKPLVRPAHGPMPTACSRACRRRKT